MKCYRCGEESPEPVPTREELARELLDSTARLVMLKEQRRDGVCQLKCIACGAETDIVAGPRELTDEINILRDDLKEAEERIEELRGELRRYEPSDGLMYKIDAMQGQLDEAARLLTSPHIKVGSEEMGNVDAWRERHKRSIVLAKAPVDHEHLRLHTTIDEARRLFDRLRHDPPVPAASEQLGKDIDEWRNRVLVKEARERTDQYIDKPSPFADSALRSELAAETRRADTWLMRYHVAAKLLQDWRQHPQREDWLRALDQRTHTLLSAVDQGTDEAKAWIDELHTLRRTRKAMLENNRWQACKLDAVYQLAAKWAEADEPGNQVQGNAVLDVMNAAADRPPYSDDTVVCSYTWSDDEQIIPNDGYGALRDTGEKLTLIFDCGTVMACADISYAYLDKVLNKSGRMVALIPQPAVTWNDGPEPEANEEP